MFRASRITSSLLAVLFAGIAIAVATAAPTRPQGHARQHVAGNSTRRARLVKDISGVLAGLPPVQLTGRLATLVSSVANRTGGSSTNALASVRVLRSSLGLERTSLYGFMNGNGVPCFFVAGENGTCVTDAATTQSGVYWGVAGGYPAWGSPIGVEIPPAVDGLVASSVTALSLHSSGNTTSVPIVNNAFYAVLPPTGAGWNVELVAVYADGSQHVIKIPNVFS